MFRNFLIALSALIGFSIFAVPASARDMNFVVACRDTYLKDHQITEEGARHLQIGTTINGMTLDGVHLRTVWGACIKQADLVGIAPAATSRPAPVAAPRPIPAHAAVIAPKATVPTPQPKPVAAAPQLRPSIPARAPMTQSMLVPAPQAHPVAAAVPASAKIAAAEPAVKASPPAGPATKGTEKEYTDTQLAAFVATPAAPPAKIEAVPAVPHPAAPARAHVSKKLIAISFGGILLVACLALLVVRLFRRKPEQPGPNKGRKPTIFDTAPADVEAPALHVVPQEAAATAELSATDLVEEEAPTFARPADIDDEPLLQPAEEEDLVEVAPTEEINPIFLGEMPVIDMSEPLMSSDTPDDIRRRNEMRATLGPMVSDPLDGFDEDDTPHEHPRAA